MKQLSTYLSVGDLRNSIELSERGIRQLVQRGKIADDYYRYEQGAGRGGKQLRIHPEGLPEPYKTQFFTAQDSEQLESAAVDRLEDYQRDYAMARLDVVRLLKKEMADAKAEGRNINPVWDEVADIYNTGHLLEQAFEQLGSITTMTLRRWVKKYDNAHRHGKNVVVALAPAYGRKKGKRSIPEWYQQKLLDVLLHPNSYSISRAIKTVNMALKHGGKDIPVSKRTAQRWVNDWKNSHYDTWIMAREGRKALNDKVLPYLDRDWNLLEVGDVLIADGHVLNIDVKHPQTGKRHRPILITFFDGRSRYPVGFSLMPTENTDNIAEALADAIQTLGKLPKAVIIDNGKAFKGKFFTRSADFHDAGIAGVYEQLGVHVHFTKPYHGQSKPVERFFGELDVSFSKALPTYRGASIEKKPPRLKRGEPEHQAAYEKIVGGYLPTIAEVVDSLKLWAQQVYGREHYGSLRDGETPLGVLEAGQGPGVPMGYLLPLMFRSKLTRPRRARFRIEGIVYSNWDVLTGWNKRLLVRYTRNQPERVWVFDPDAPANDSFMCVAHAVEAVHPLEALTDEDGGFNTDIRARLQQRKKLEDRATDAQQMLESYNNAMPGGGTDFLPEHLRDLPDAGAESDQPYLDVTDVPDASPDMIEEAKEIAPIEIEVSQEEGDPLFNEAWQRFEHIAGKARQDITPDDIEFLEDFVQSVSWDLYADEHEDWVNELIDNEQ